MISKIPLNVLAVINEIFVILTIISFVAIVIIAISLFFVENKKMVLKQLFVAIAILFISFTGCVQTLSMNFN